MLQDDGDEQGGGAKVQGESSVLRGFASGSKAFYFHPKRGKEIWLQVCSQDVEGEVAAKFELKKSGNGQFYFSLRAANGEPKEAI